MKLRCETNTVEMELIIRRDAHNQLRAADGIARRLQADFEHGQWWLTDIDTGAQWAVNDLETVDGIAGFDYEQVTQGDEDE